MQVGPRLSFTTAWSANAASVCASCGLGKVVRIEPSRRLLFHARQPLRPAEQAALAAAVRTAGRLRCNMLAAWCRQHLPACGAQRSPATSCAGHALQEPVHASAACSVAGVQQPARMQRLQALPDHNPRQHQ